MCWLICLARQGIKADGKLDKHLGFIFIFDFATPSLELDAVDRPKVYSHHGEEACYDI